MGKVIASLQGDDIGEEASDNGAWRRFSAELDAWARDGRIADFWWRDDDATQAGPKLDRLLTLATGRPLSLAVIPQAAQQSLASRLRKHNAGGGNVSVVQHGLSHQNHAPTGAKKAEFGDHRPTGPMLDEISRGRRRLGELFGDMFVPVFTPPWNRISQALANRLGEAGLVGLSRFSTRAAEEGNKVVNTHIDILDWSGNRGFIGTDSALDAAIAHLAARRRGDVDAGEPTGLLTHHRDHDEGCWLFVAAFLDAVDRHESAKWVACPAGEA